jgi:hypothetical protein
VRLPREISGSRTVLEYIANDLLNSFDPTKLSPIRPSS